MTYKLKMLLTYDSYKRDYVYNDQTHNPHDYFLGIIHFNKYSLLTNVVRFNIVIYYYSDISIIYHDFHMKGLIKMTRTNVIRKLKVSMFDKNYSNTILQPDNYKLILSEVRTAIGECCPDNTTIYEWNDTHFPITYVDIFLPIPQGSNITKQIRILVNGTKLSINNKDCELLNLKSELKSIADEFINCSIGNVISPLYKVPTSDEIGEYLISPAYFVDAFKTVFHEIYRNCYDVTVNKRNDKITIMDKNKSWSNRFSLTIDLHDARLITLVNGISNKSFLPQFRTINCEGPQIEDMNKVFKCLYTRI